ncbi:MAG: AAA family ATPase [Aphanocapsa feldmannii 277cI]|uniref:AAA family ATPase n=1 Tax=Aphanocapsa feldmannii 277cI TaxID=2507554 RepID=A0A524RTK0_9CHRO|nr:MAG: AAA family ATPase [Aphanocapsa feldmannii 277cI]
MPNTSTAITRIRLKHFTAFESLDLSPSPGINALLGANGTGKTHLMKVAYAACDVRTSKARFSDKLVRLFLPSNQHMGRLIHRRPGSSQAIAEVAWGEESFIRTTFSNRTKSAASAGEAGAETTTYTGQSAYIPVKEMLANTPGFRSLYSSRSIYFEEIYSDILDRAFLPPLRGSPDLARRELLETLRKALEGKVSYEGEEFFIRSKQGKLEKLGLLWLLIQNGTLTEESILFWDEPETNLNPRLFRPVVDILLELQRQSVQIFIATHDYLILKLLDLRMTSDDKVVYHAFYRDNDELVYNTVDSYLEITPNAIAETFSNVYDLEVRRSLEANW